MSDEEPPQRPADLETLRLAYSEYADRIGRLRSGLAGAGGQIVVALGSSALMLGLFGAFRPEKTEAITSLLFAGALIPFLVVAFSSLAAPMTTLSALALRTKRLKLRSG